MIIIAKQKFSKHLVWERQECESVIAYKAFRTYLESSSREINFVAEELSKNKNTIRKWAEKYEWEQRAAVWDFMRREIAKENAAKETQEMADIQIKIGRKLQAQAMNALREKDLSDEPVPVILRAVELGIQIERSARNIEKKSL